MSSSTLSERNCPRENSLRTNIVEWKISLDAILQLAGTIGVIIAMYVKITNRLTGIETMLLPIWKWWNEESGDETMMNRLDGKVEHAVRAAVAKVIPEIIRQDREFRNRR